MRAWRLDPERSALTYDDFPVPTVRPGAVRVRVEASAVVSYLRDYVAGRLPGYHPPPGPFTPGTNAIGVVAETGPGVYALSPGDRVLLTGYYTAAENVPEPAQALLGITAAPDSADVLATWRDGTFAEEVVVPASTVTPVPPALSDLPAERLAVVSRMLVPYGGLLRSRLVAGETVVVNGATGAYGRVGVLVALAMGAARVVAAGRNGAVLSELAALDGVHPVRLTGDVAADAAALRGAAGGHLDAALDMVGGAASTAATRAALAALGRGGRLVLMGGATVPLEIDYAALMLTGKEVLGNFMYPAQAPARLMALAASGRLDLAAVPTRVYALHDLVEAMDAAAEAGAPLVVVRP